VLGITELLALAAYGVTQPSSYWRLRTSNELQTEIAETRSWVRCTPPWNLFADLLVPAMPLIAELTCLINGLLWPAEMLTRPWRSRDMR